MQRVTLCSCLKQVMESLLLVSGCSERVGGVWHKRGFQLAEPRTDGAGKWGTSQKHWNPLQRPPHTLLSSLHKWAFFLCQDYLKALVIAQTSDKKKWIKLLKMDHGDEDVWHIFLIVRTQGALGHLPVWVFVHLDGASRWQGWVWASPGNNCREPRKQSHFLKHSLAALPLIHHR